MTKAQQQKFLKLVQGLNEVMANADSYESMLAAQALQAQRDYILQKYGHRRRRYARF